MEERAKVRRSKAARDKAVEGDITVTAVKSQGCGEGQRWRQE